MRRIERRLSIRQCLWWIEYLRRAACQLRPARPNQRRKMDDLHDTTRFSRHDEPAPPFRDVPTWDKPEIIDPRFRVARIAAHGVTVFMRADSDTPFSQVRWEFVEGTRVILADYPDEPLKRLIENYPTKELIRLLGIQTRIIHLLRLHLGLPTGPTGQHGGARPKAGRRKKRG